MSSLALFNQVFNEAEYLVEWLEYHIMQGVDKFYISDHSSTDATPKILEYYKNKRILSYIKIPTTYGSPECWNGYKKLLKMVDTDWIGLADVDEFYLTKDPLETIKQVLKDFEQYAGIAICWQMFNSNGHIKKPAGLVIENYDKAIPVADPFKPHMKMIFKRDRIDIENISNPHFFRPINGFKVVDELHRLVNSPFPITQTISRIQQNHYWSKSKEEFIIKCDKGRSDVHGCPKRDPNGIIEFDQRQTYIDRSIFRFIPELKERVEKVNKELKLWKMV